jgi:hypothetical protein
MSALLEALRTRQPLPTRAERIKAEGDRKRAAYSALNPAADAAMVFGAQIGYLHGQIVALCNEAEALVATRNPQLGYVEVFCDELDADVLVGFDYTPGEESRTYGPPENCYEGSPEELEVCEVWLNGADIAAVLLERVAEQLTAAALERVRQQQADARDSAAEARAEARRDAREWA